MLGNKNVYLSLIVYETLYDIYLLNVEKFTLETTCSVQPKRTVFSTLYSLRSIRIEYMFNSGFIIVVYITQRRSNKHARAQRATFAHKQ